VRAADWDPGHLNVLGVNEVRGRSAVDQRIERKLHSIVGRFNLQREVEGVSARHCSDRIALREFALPGRLTGWMSGQSWMGDWFS
jgi:hypothetical protein